MRTNCEREAVGGWFGRPSRREVLRAGALVAAAPAIARVEALTGEADTDFTFAYFSDTHVSINRNVQENEVLLREIAQNVVPAFAINGGDVVDYGWHGEYDNLQTITKGLPYRIHCVPGNHDVRWAGLGLQIFSDRVGSPFQAFQHRGVWFFLLDSTVPLSHYGHYESAMLRWLEDGLKRAGRETPVFIATHHWVGRDRVMIDNEHTLQRILEPYNVKVVLTGHGHTDTNWKWDGLDCVMNRGLYQGSFMRIDVDRRRGEVRVQRRSGDTPELRPVLATPLAPSREKRPVWQIWPATLEAGRAVRVVGEGATDHRWNDGAWIAGGERASTDTLGPGDHLLTLRSGASGPWNSRTVRVDDPSATLRLDWATRLTGGVFSHLLLVEPGRRDARRWLYLSAMDGSVVGLDPDTGKVRWRAQTGGYCHSSPRVSGNVLVVGSADAHVYGIDRLTGRVRWRHRTQGPVYGSAAFAKGVAAIASGDGTVVGLDPDTGRRRWLFQIPKSDVGFSQSPAATDGERFFIGAWDKNLYCLDAASGHLVWSQVCTDRSFAFSPAIGGPAIDDENRVFVPANGNELYAFERPTGKLLWKATSPGDKFGYSGPAVSGDRIVIGCLGDIGEARCVSTRTGEILWTATVGAVIYDSSPAIHGRYATVGSVNGTVWLLELETGRVAGSYRMPPGHILASPAIDSRRVYCGSYSDHVVGLTIGA